MRKPVSIMHDGESCYICGRNGCGDPLEWHHVFGGANRKLSEKYGLKVRLCGKRCHNGGKESVHINADVRHALQEEAQIKFEETYTDENFFVLFGKNYIST